MARNEGVYLCRVFHSARVHLLPDLPHERFRIRDKLASHLLDHASRLRHGFRLGSRQLRNGIYTGFG
jgi:hypothetical protein